MGASSIPRETLFKMRMREAEDDYASLADDCRYFEERAKALESENASLRGAVQGLGELCDKYKAENAKLRMCLGDGCADCAVGMGDYADSLCDPLKAENAKLRELVRTMHGELVSCEDNGYVCGGHKFDGRIRDLGIEVSE